MNNLDNIFNQVKQERINFDRIDLKFHKCINSTPIIPSYQAIPSFSLVALIVLGMFAGIELYQQYDFYQEALANAEFSTSITSSEQIYSAAATFFE